MSDRRRPRPLGLSRRAALRASLAVPTGIALAATAGCAPGWQSLSGRDLTVATGNKGGVFDRYGDALAEVLARRLDGVTTRTVSTDASVENVRLVASGDADIAFSLADTAADAARGTGGFPEPQRLVALARAYDSFVQLVVRADSAITDVRDLRGRHAGLGAVGSGTRVIAGRILEVAGVRESGLQVTTSSLQESAADLAAGRLDAFFFVSGVPNSAIADLASHLPVRLVDLDRWLPGLRATYRLEYGPGPIPASTYDLPRGVDTVSVKNYILATAGMPDHVAYAVTRVMFEQQDEIDRLAPGVRQPSLAAAIFTSPLPLHQGALRYYRETQP